MQCTYAGLNVVIYFVHPLDQSQWLCNKYFELKKLVGRQWGAPNSNYLLVIVSTFDMP